MTFARPLLLLLLVALPAVVVVAPAAAVSPRGCADERRPPGDRPQRATVGRPACPCRCEVDSVSPPVVAAAGPRLGSARASCAARGFSIILAVDVSRQHAREDFSPANRLDVRGRHRRNGHINAPHRSVPQIAIKDTSSPLPGKRWTHGAINTDYQVLGEAISPAARRIWRTARHRHGIATSQPARRAPGKSKVVVLLTTRETTRARSIRVRLAQAAPRSASASTPSAWGTRARRRSHRPGPAGPAHETMPVKIGTSCSARCPHHRGRYFRATTRLRLQTFRRDQPARRRRRATSRDRRYDEAYRSAPASDC